MARRTCLECGEHFGSKRYEEYLHPLDYQCSGCMADHSVRIHEGVMVNLGYRALLECEEIDIVTGEINGH